MRAGTLRHVIDIQDAVETADGMGGFTTVFTAIANGTNLRASIWPLSASERIASDKVELLITHRIRTRYRGGIKADMRIKHGADYYQIKSIINPEMRDIMLEMLCEEIDGES